MKSEILLCLALVFSGVVVKFTNTAKAINTIMSFWPRQVWGILLLAALGCRPHAQELRLGVFPAREDIVQNHGGSSIYLDRDGLHVVVVAHAGKQFIVYADGRPGPAYDAIGGVALSPAGGHIAYAARKGAQWFLVFEGKEGAPCDGINEAWDYKPQYGPNGPYTGYSIGEPNPDAALLFSDDGKHFACALQNGAKHRVIMDGLAGPEYDAVGELRLSAGGQHFAYLAKQGVMQFAVINGKPGPAYSGVGPLALSRDGLHAAYVAWQAKKYFTLADGQAGPPFDFILLFPFGFSADGAHLTYTALVDRQEAGNYGPKQVVVVDGRALPQGGSAPVFSADGRHEAHLIAEVVGNNATQVVVDGQPGPKHPAVFNAQLSPDGRHVAYLACDRQKYFEVFDGKPGPEYDRITGQILSPDGRRIAYEARIGVPGSDFHGRPITNDTEMAQPFIVVDGTPGPKYDGVYQLIFSPDSRHVAYEAYKNGHWLVVLDTKEGVAYSHIWGLKFSTDGQHLAYVAAKENGKNMSDRMVAVVDGHESREYEMVLEDSWPETAPIFTANRSLAYFAVRWGVLYRVTQPLALVPSSSSMPIRNEP